jgi:hypothetical protein
VGAYGMGHSSPQKPVSECYKLIACGEGAGLSTLLERMGEVRMLPFCSQMAKCSFQNRHVR